MFPLKYKRGWAGGFSKQNNVRSVKREGCGVHKRLEALLYEQVETTSLLEGKAPREDPFAGYKPPKSGLLRLENQNLYEILLRSTVQTAIVLIISLGVIVFDFICNLA